jgi:O-antigen/teichoic acid export membrane protein
MGLYSLLGSVYGFSITLASFGINLGTTKTVSEALGLGNVALARKCAKNLKKRFCTNRGKEKL